MRALALMPLLWAVAWLLVDAGGYWLTAGTAFLIISFSAVLLGVGECFHGPAHQALVSDIGAPHLRGRYFAVHSLSWGLAGFVGPAAAPAPRPAGGHADADTRRGDELVTVEN